MAASVKINIDSPIFFVRGDWLWYREGY